MGASEENGSVPALTEPQTWTVIGAVIALMFSMLTIVSTLLIRVVRAEIGGVRGEIAGLRGEIGGLDRDVRALVKHTFGLDRGE